MRLIFMAILFTVTTIINAAPADDFVITVKTDNPGAGTNTNFIIYKQPGTGFNYNYNVDCDNDGTDEATSQTVGYTCNYTVAGIYTIRIKDNSGTGDGFPGFILSQGINSVAEKLLTVEQWGTGKWKNLDNAFRGAINLVFNANDVPDLSNVTSLISMFSGAEMANPNTSNWNTSAVTNMRRMFKGATSANPDTSNWDTSQVTDMEFMFFLATSANPDTSNWDISNVTSMGGMFAHVTLPTNSYENMLIGFAAQNLQSNVSFNAGYSRSCSAAAQAAKASLIANYNWTITDGGVCDPSDDFVIRIKSDNPGGSPTDFLIKAYGSSDNFNVDCDNDGVLEAVAQSGDYTCDYGSSGAGIYTIRIIDNTGLGTGYTVPRYSGSSTKEKILSIEQWGTSLWTSMLAAFTECSNLVINATDSPNMSNVTSMNGMFLAATIANPDTSDWDVSAVTDMEAMFLETTLANPNTSNWDTSAVTSMSYMFSDATSANPDVSNWDTSAVIDMSGMFFRATAANPDVSNWDTTSVKNMTAMFSQATSANPDVSNWNTSSVTSTWSMFSNATSASPVISNWDVSSVTNMTGMFSGITLPTSEYDAILVNFSVQNLKSNVNFNAGNSQYCSSAAQAARASMISFNGWNITDGGMCPAEIFTDGFESTVVTFKTTDAQFAFDFSDVELLPKDETPQLIAAGLDQDNQVNVKIYLRQLDGVLEIMQSQLLEDVDGEQLWSDGLWYEVFEQG